MIKSTKSTKYGILKTGKGIDHYGENCNRTDNIFRKLEENLRKAEQFIKRAKAEKAKMIVFPEYFMNYYPDADHKYIEKAQTLHGDFVSQMKVFAKEYKMWIIFGMNEKLWMKQRIIIRWQ